MRNPRLSLNPPLGLSVILAATSIVPANAAFPLPQEEASPFRRDRLALPLDQQQTLAEELIRFAKSFPSDTAAGRHSQAQALALALAIHPGKAEARVLLARLSQGESSSASPIDFVFLQKIQSWLESRPDEDSKTVAACLKDLLEPGSEEQSSAWTGWVPEANAYEIHSPDGKSSPEMLAETPAPIVEKDVFKLASARVDVLVTLTNETTGEESRAVLHLGMKGEWGSKFGLDGNMGKMLSRLQPILEKRHSDLPKGTISLTLQTRKGDAPPRGGEVSAAAFVLADAAISGKEPNALVMGQISDEKYQLPPEFWASLNALSDQEHAGRLILPSSSTEYLHSLLVLDKADFFLKHEVCLATSLDDLIELASKTLSSEAAAAAHRKFEALMALSKTVPISRLLADPKVRAQLEEISRALPYHASARMLALQAAGKRPVSLPRKVALEAFREALRPIDWAGKSEHFPDFNETPRLESGYEACRSRLAAFEKLVNGSDSDLGTEVNEVLLKFRALTRSYRSKDVNYYGSVGIEKAFLAFTKSYIALQEHLKAGDGAE